jgi:hypothetical protein
MIYRFLRVVRVAPCGRDSHKSFRIAILLSFDCVNFNLSGDSCLIDSLSCFCISVTGIVEDLSIIDISLNVFILIARIILSIYSLAFKKIESIIAIKRRSPIYITRLTIQISKSRK